MISVVIPTYNAAAYIPALFDTLSKQSVSMQLIVIDSQSTDNTPLLLQKRGIPFVSIPASTFNHGGTRNLGVSMAQYENIVMLTQDALPTKENTLEVLVNMMNSCENIGMAYGRQLPYPDADLMSVYARQTNYPPQSDVKSIDDIPRLGIRTCHCSNSFAAYKKSALLAVGGFPIDTVLGEDVVVAARLIKAGRPLAYCAEAQVVHSHNYNLTEEFKRYFDIGAFHEQQRDLLKDFQRAESEGFRYVLDEWQYLAKQGAVRMIPTQLLRTGAKYIGYRLGRMHDRFSINAKRRMSMHAKFWAQQTTTE